MRIKFYLLYRLFWVSNENPSKRHGKKSWKHLMNSFFRPSFSTKMAMWTPNSCWPRKRPWTTPRPPWPPLNLIPNLWKRLTPPLQKRNPQPKNPSPLTEKVRKSCIQKGSAKKGALNVVLWFVILFICSSVYRIDKLGTICVPKKQKARETKLINHNFQWKDSRPKETWLKMLFYYF